MDANENYPSLIDCLDTGRNGIFLDLDPASDHSDGPARSVIRKGPFCKTLHARIVTSGLDTIERVHLVMQRDRYDIPDSLVPVNNSDLDAAWQKAVEYHSRSGRPKAPVFFKHQVNAEGAIQAFNSLFQCRETKRWFHPVCPQCGMMLTLCSDDGLLEKYGLPKYTDSLVRFLYCESCAQLSDATPFYSREKTAGMPDVVQDKDALIAQWKSLLEKLPGEAGLPCRGCPAIDACYGPEMLANRRIEPIAFYPFRMLMFPAPSCSAVEFLNLISGATTQTPAFAEAAFAPSESDGFLFQGKERQFLEIFYLKLSFLEMVCHQLLVDDASGTIPEIDLSLDGIGVDLSPAGVGLPAYWQFDVRFLNAIGSFQSSPFAPRLPEAPRLHFIGALWFRALLANSVQGAEAVFTEVGRLLDQMAAGDSIGTWPTDTDDPASVFAANQIYWTPGQHRVPGKWQPFWKVALRSGMQLVQAGLKAGAAWDGRAFLDDISTLRLQIKTEMFSSPDIESSVSTDSVQQDRVSSMLGKILEKWQAAADTPIEQSIIRADAPTPEADETIVFSPSPATQLPADNEFSPHAGKIDTPVNDGSALTSEGTEWGQGGQETVILSTTDTSPSAESVPIAGTVPPAQDSQWDDSIEETVVLQSAAASIPDEKFSTDDPDRTVVISPSTTNLEQPLTDTDSDLTATVIQTAPGSPPSSPPGQEGDDEATMIISAGGTPASESPMSSSDDDLEATMIQGVGGQAAGTAPSPEMTGGRPLESAQSGEDPESTVIIGSAGFNNRADHIPPTSDDDLAATLIETPRRNDDPSGQQATPENASPMPPPAPQTPRDAPKPHPGTSVDGQPETVNEDDDIMEQTIIIRSDVTKK